MIGSLNETIAAAASAHGAAARGVIRLSGPATPSAVLSVLFEEDRALWRSLFEKNQPMKRNARLNLFDSEAASVSATIFFWPAGRGYTGEESAEIQTTGSPPILDKLLARLNDGGARLANRGEFTLRAFLNRRLDLTQAEAVLGVIDARRDDALKAALGQLAGNLAVPLTALRGELLDALADLEAGLDFADEAISFISPETLRERIESVQRRIDSLAETMTCRGRTNSARCVALTGPPNAGKSALFNRLKERFGVTAAPDALVSNRAGTTRDWLETTLDLDGLAVRLVDTAGVEDEPVCADSNRWDHEERIAEAARRQSAAIRQSADLVLECREANVPDASKFSTDCEMEKSSGSAADIVTDVASDVASADRVIRVETKADLLGDFFEVRENGRIRTSAKNGGGLDLLAAAIRRYFHETEATDAVPSTAQRCRSSLIDASGALDRARRLVGADEVLVASELRLALDSLGQVTGAVHTDDLLDRIFSRFCIGK